MKKNGSQKSRFTVPLKGQSHKFFGSRFFSRTAPPGPSRDVLGPFWFLLLLGWVTSILKWLPGVLYNRESRLSSTKDSFGFSENQLLRLPGTKDTRESRLSGAQDTGESFENAYNSAKKQKNQNSPRTSLIGPGGAVWEKTDYKNLVRLSL